MGGKAGVDYYFLDDFGGSFKATVMYYPYFLIATKVWELPSEPPGPGTRSRTRTLNICIHSSISKERSKNGYDGNSKVSSRGSHG